MAGLGGMDKKCRGSGGSKCRGHFATDVTAFAHAHDHDAALYRKNGLHRLYKRIAQIFSHTFDGLRFNGQGLPGQRKNMGCLYRPFYRHGLSIMRCVRIAFAAHLPMQNRLNISPSKSSGVNLPVSADRAWWARRHSSANISNAGSVWLSNAKACATCSMVSPSAST